VVRSQTGKKVECIHLASVIVGNKLSVEKLHFNVAELFHLRNSSSIQSKNSLQIGLHHKLCHCLLMNQKKEYDEVSAEPRIKAMNDEFVNEWYTENGC
jgi:hypothetical protein